MTVRFVKMYSYYKVASFRYRRHLPASVRESVFVCV
uniref:Uncharacterized protein n=1 Tax=Anopheles quadriannulatus TaxID=34691 RepID=A0A182XQS0_ANOQN